MKRFTKRGLALMLAGIMMFASAVGVMPVNAAAEQQSEEAKATLLFCSDFQTEEEVDPYENLSSVPEGLFSILKNITKTIYNNGYTKINNVLAVGDYSAYIEQYNYDADPIIAINIFQSIFEKQWRDNQNFMYIQGNHDSDSYPYHEGANEYEEYIVYCINGTYNAEEMGGFPWNQGVVAGSEQSVKLAAENMRNYFEECIAEGENRPVFIMVHVPLHFTGRTSSLYSSGDNLYASYIFNVVNSAAEDLDIVYLFGHNHSKGWDSYMGGSRVFKQPGDTILIPDLSRKGAGYTDYYTEETLNFTYLNAGYTGYVADYAAADELTATVCVIYDDKLVFERYSEDSRVAIGASGTYNERYDDSDLISDDYFATETASPVQVTIERTKESGVKMEDSSGLAGKETTMRAVVKNMEAVSYDWSISDASVAVLKGEGKIAKILGKQAGTTEVTVIVKDQEGNSYSTTAMLEITAKETKTAVRTDAFVSGEKYLLIGGSQDYSSVRPAVTTNSAYGNKGDGVQVLRGANVSGLDLTDLGNSVETTVENLWTYIEGDNGTAAFYNESAQKYMHFQQGNKSVTLQAEPTYFEIAWTDYDTSYGVAGRAAGFHSGTWYLNYSDRQAGFCCYNASTYNQDATHFTNQYGIYAVRTEKDALDFMITWAEELEAKGYKASTWNAMQNALAEAKNAAENENATQNEVDAAAENLETAIASLEKETVIDLFDDVHQDWYTEYVQYVYDYGLMTGVKGTDHFAPGGNVTKAQVAQVLYNLEGQPEIRDTSVFSQLTDVSSTEWYGNAVAWAYHTGVVTGNTATGKFSPSASVTREQLAVMLYRYAQYKGYDLSKTSDLAGLKNADKVQDYAMNAVKWAVGSGLISGSVTGTDASGVEIRDLKPQGSTTRAQMAAILQRFCEKNQLTGSI